MCVGNYICVWGHLVKMRHCVIYFILMALLCCSELKLSYFTCPSFTPTCGDHAYTHTNQLVGTFRELFLSVVFCIFLRFKDIILVGTIKMSPQVEMSPQVWCVFMFTSPQVTKYLPPQVYTRCPHKYYIRLSVPTSLSIFEKLKTRLIKNIFIG